MDRLLKLFRALFWLCFIALTGLALSPAPYLPPMDIFNWWDKAQHAIGYGTLMMTALIAYPNTSKLRLAVLLGLHGCLIEVLQYFSGYRFGDWQDAAADGFGVFLGWVLGSMVQSLIFSKLEGKSGLTDLPTPQSEANNEHPKHDAAVTSSAGSNVTVSSSSKEAN